MSTVRLKPDTWALIIAAPAGKISFQNQTRGDVWFLTAATLPTGVPHGVKYGINEGEADVLLTDIFPDAGANLYAYTQLSGPIYING